MADLTLSSESHDFDSLKKKYAEFLAPTIKVTVNGQEITKQYGITQLRVDSTIEGTASSFSFRLAMPTNLEEPEASAWPGSLKLGSSIDISMGYAETFTAVFSGYITSLTGEFTEQETPGVVVRGMDTSFLMMRGAKHKTWEKKKYSDIVKELAGTHKLSSHVDETTFQLPVAVQAGVSDYHFIQQMAHLVAYDFFIVGKNLYFRKPNKDTTPVLKLSWGVGLRSLSIDMNIADQLTAATVVSWDVKKQQKIQGKAGDIVKIGKHSKTGKDLLKTLGTYEETVYSNAVSDDEAKTYATAHMQRKSMELVSGSGECIGIPELQAGRYIEFDKVGDKLNGKYCLSTVTHLIDDDGYVTRFRVRGNAVS